MSGGGRVPIHSENTVRLGNGRGSRESWTAAETSMPARMTAASVPLPWICNPAELELTAVPDVADATPVEEPLLVLTCT